MPRSKWCSNCKQEKEPGRTSAYCKTCRNKKNKEWIIKTGRVDNNQAGLCPCGAPRAPRQRYFCLACKAQSSREYRARRGHTQTERDRFNAWYQANKDQIKSRKKDDPALRLRVFARRTVNNALRDGVLVRQACEVCGIQKPIEAHHDDYSQPLKVRWLCRKHHNEHHRNQVLKE